MEKWEILTQEEREWYVEVKKGIYTNLSELREHIEEIKYTDVACSGCFSGFLMEAEDSALFWEIDEYLEKNA